MWMSSNWYNTGVTVELGKLLENGVNVWDFEYPCFYEGEQKTAFEKKILDHYRFHQIGQETVGRWLHYFRTRMREIMPYYNQLYKSEALLYSKEDPLESYHLVEEFNMERDATDTYSGETGTNVTRATDTEHRFSNTPQGRIENIDTHMTEASKDNVTGTDSGTETSESSSEHSGNVKTTMVRRGNIGVQPLGDEIQKLRNAFLNIDMMVINELKDLFLLVY